MFRISQKPVEFCSRFNEHPRLMRTRFSGLPKELVNRVYKNIITTGVDSLFINNRYQQREITKA